MRPLLPWLLLLLVACGGDDTIVSTDDDALDPEPVTPDELVAAFVEAWENLDFEAYDALLHEEFRFRFAIEDMKYCGDETGVWDRDREMACVSDLFGGVAGSDPLTAAVWAPLQGVNLTLTPIGHWTDEVAADFTGTWLREYSVEMRLDFSDGNGRVVLGIQRLYVVAVEVGEATTWQLKFWQDLGKDSGGKLPNGEASWGEVKACW